METPRRGTNVPACTVVVVTYNSAAEIGDFLGSLDAAAPSSDLEVVVVDNASDDDTLGEVEAFRRGGQESPATRRRLTAVSAEGNLGYAGGVNVGRRHRVAGSAVLVANPDLRFAPGAIDTLLQALDDADVGIAVPRLLSADGAVSRSLRREPSLTRELGEALLGDHLPGRPACLSEIVRSSDAYDAPHDVDWATGAAFMMSPACDRAVGDWDESFFLYSEEVDAARRARAAGFRVRYVPSAVAVHHGGASGSSADLVALQAVNRVRYYERYHGRLRSVLHRSLVVVHELLRGSDASRRRAAAIVARRSRWADLPR